MTDVSKWCKMLYLLTWKALCYYHKYGCEASVYSLCPSTHQRHIRKSMILLEFNFKINKVLTFFFLRKCIITETRQKLNVGEKLIYLLNQKDKKWVYYIIGEMVDSYKWTGYLHPYSKYDMIKVRVHACLCLFLKDTFMTSFFFSNLAL